MIQEREQSGSDRIDGKWSEMLAVLWKREPIGFDDESDN